jgi:hypothetical protein
MLKENISLVSDIDGSDKKQQTIFDKKAGGY